MKWALTLMAAAGVFLATLSPAAPPPRAPETRRIAGRDYVRLSEWARANHCDSGWLKRDETFQVSNRQAKILLTVDSRETELNGVEVLLSFPLVDQAGAAYISQLDARATLQPMLFPPKNAAGTKIRSVCLDPGHGGKDPGEQTGSNAEKKFTLLLADEVRKQLSHAGLKASLTRSSDKFVDLPDRPEIARQRGADLFVSLHFNSSKTARESVHGSEVYCLTPQGANSTNDAGEAGDTSWCVGNRNNDKNVYLAYQLQRALTRGAGVGDHGVRRARYAVLRDAVMPAVLVEAGFLSHPEESRKILTSAYRRQLAHALVEGLMAYKHQVEVGS